ncbi:hypothetical protein C5167_030035 [Papaver somniferum]|nr:hypothetical protein C5167_030035 [Papaver somniferum]
MAGVPACKEVVLGFLSDNNTDLCHADILIYNWENGQDVCIDVTGVSPFTVDGIRAIIPGQAVSNVVLRKHTKYLDKCVSHGKFLFYRLGVSIQKGVGAELVARLPAKALSLEQKVLIPKRSYQFRRCSDEGSGEGSLGALATTVGSVMYMHSYQGGARLLSLGIILILYTMFMWWRDVLHESTLEGHHTKVRSCWPPKGILVLDPWAIPFLNTLILLSSRAASTWDHHVILAGKERRAIYALVATFVMGLVSTGFQVMEYYQAPFTISESVHRSTFSLATGFHGFHVIIGTLFSIVCGFSQYLGHLTKEHHVDFEAAAWYWHFVDVVWLFPFVSIYWWGGI